MSRHICTLAAAAGLAISGTMAHGAFFSFASDTDDASWTFTYDAQTRTISDAEGLAGPGLSPDPIRLLIDDNNGATPAIEVMANLDASLTLSSYAGVGNGGLVIHTYLLNGSFDFMIDDGNGNAVPGITVQVQDSVMTAAGNQSNWFSTAAMQGSSDAPSDVQYIVHPVMLDMFPDLANLGVFVGESIPFEDFGFDLTVLNTNGKQGFDPGANPQDRGVSLGQDLFPAQQWYSEASFSGSAQFIPTTGSVSVLAISGLALGARRRRQS